MKKPTPIAQFESLARRLIEGSARRLFGDQIDPLEVSSQIARALEDSQRDGQAADFFRIRLHPDDYTALYRQNPRLATELSGYVTDLARKAGFYLPIPPDVEITADPNLSRQQVRVEAEHTVQADEPTQIQPRPLSEAAVKSAIRAIDAFLIVAGRRHVPLDQAIINMGRRTDNDIVLDAPTVSRRHAQIRWRYSRFVVYDLSNRGHTLVNNQPVTEHALQPGDVITLGDVPLIYGEGEVDPHIPGRDPKHEEDTVMMPPLTDDSDS
ncbi:MAG: FhaA domain-containing protein [Chloroflexota bacterium]